MTSTAAVTSRARTATPTQLARVAAVASTAAAPADRPPTLHDAIGPPPPGAFLAPARRPEDVVRLVLSLGGTTAGTVAGAFTGAPQGTAPRPAVVPPAIPVDHEVASLLRDLRQEAGDSAGRQPSAVARAALDVALDQVGRPYVWGATGPGAFDCSGLTMSSYAAVGVTIPRVSAAQYAGAGRAVATADLRPGDLVFFATEPWDPGVVHHVGMYVGRGLMVDAPHPGAYVRVEPVPAAGYVGGVRVTGHGTGRPGLPSGRSAGPATHPTTHPTKPSATPSSAASTKARRPSRDHRGSPSPTRPAGPTGAGSRHPTHAPSPKPSATAPTAPSTGTPASSAPPTTTPTTPAVPTAPTTPTTPTTPALPTTAAQGATSASDPAAVPAG